MNTLDFLNLVWPSNGLYLVLIPTQWTDKITQKPVFSFKHFAHQTIDSAAAHARALATDPNYSTDVYFALGSVKEDLTHTKKIDRDALGKKVRGQHKSGFDMTQAIRCFWLDLDVKPHPTAYATVQEAADSLRGFVTAMGLPRPYVTSSGGGLHVYWPLLTELDADKWAHYANILKQLTHSWGLKADDSRTADRGSILRPVGTYNWKTGTAREVKVVVNGTVSDTDQFLGRLAFMADTFKLPPVAVRPAQMQLTGTPLTIPGQPLAVAVNVSAMNDAAAAGAGYEQADPREVVSRCRQLAWQASNQTLVPEPAWYAMIGCMRHAKDGIKAVHFMSKQNPTYDPTTTAIKIQQLDDNGIGPSLCTTFESHNPGGCDGCPYKGKIKTPLQTVRRLEQAAPPTVQLLTPVGSVAVTLPNPPAPYKRVVNPMTGTARIAMTVGLEDGTDEDVVIYEYDLYPARLVRDERSGHYKVVICRWLPHEGWEEFEVDLGDFYDKRNLSKTIGNIGVVVDLGRVEDVVQYMLAYIRDLQKASNATTVYAQLGWRPELDRFVLPDCVITANGIEPVTVSRNVTRALNWEPARGDLEVWKAAMATYEAPGMEAHQFGFGVGFASPLFIHTNFNGMIVSMIGLAGAGKSSSALSANSIWGQPKMGWGDMENDTPKAFFNKLGVLNNLPVTYDEHTNLDGDLISSLAYAVSKGQGRQRLTQTAEAAENHGNFNLMMLMTGNASLNARLASAKADSSAESARVFEYTVPQNTMAKAAADRIWGPGGILYSNFGLAGQVYAQQMLGSVDWTRDRIQYWVGEVDRLASVTSGERFWSAGVACVLVGFELANQCGLTNCDIQRMLNFAVGVIKGMRVGVVENTRSPVHMITEYINSNLRSTLILESTGLNGAFSRVDHAPTDKLRVRIERDTGLIYIDRADFKRFCGRAQVDSAGIINALWSSTALVNRGQRTVLGKGTPIQTTQCECLVLNLKHPDVGGLSGPIGVVAVAGPALAGTP